ncbi:MAG TPA: radical SAM protein [Clostridia bacterium]|nr:radical SAM protein [Clostridia bacterium]
MSNMVLDFKITGDCNSNCHFCWDFCKAQIGSDVEIIYGALTKLSDAGVRFVSLTGGEPLIYPDISKVLRKLHELGIKVYLSTNGYLLDTFLDDIIANVDIVGLPLDSCDRTINLKMGRSPDMFSMTLDNIRRIKERAPWIRVKIGTVVTKENINEIMCVGTSLFASDYPPDNWRVYQYTAMGNQKNNLETYSISDTVFGNLCMLLKNKFEDKVSFLSSADVSGSYLFISPQLDIQIVKEQTAVKIGNVLSMELADLRFVLEEEHGVAEQALIKRAHLAQR